MDKIKGHTKGSSRLVLCLLLITVVTHGSYGDGRDYSFRCLESGGIQLFGLEKLSTIKIEGNCTDKEPVQKDNGLFFINQTCTTKINNGHAVNITIFDSAFGEDASVAVPDIPYVISKKYRIMLICNEIPQEGIQETVVHVMQAENYNILPENVREVAEVEMRFKAGNNTDLPDISSVYIGDEFYLFLKYMGKSNVVLVPEKCAAYGGSSFSLSTEYQQELWRRFYSPCTVKNTIMEDFHVINTTMVVARMYGFRFINSPYITIVCNVRLYLGTSNPHPDRCVTRTPPPPTTTPPKPTTGMPSPTPPPLIPRRRRSYDREYDTLHVNRILKVEDRKIFEATAGALPVHKFMCLYNGRKYRVGESFPSDDGCNTCSCSSNGKAMCTKRACIGQDICSLPKVVGPCRAAFRRWWYNRITNRCESITYGGCQGNKNNFQSIRECDTRCRKGINRPSRPGRIRLPGPSRRIRLPGPTRRIRLPGPTRRIRLPGPSRRTRRRRRI